MSVLLEVRGVSKRFGALQAIERLDFDVKQGEILGIIGPNGAGKTTAINLISGVMRPDVGSTSTDLPGVMRPEDSSMSIIDTPMRSLTLERGLKNSSFSRISALTPAACVIFDRRTSGVCPIVSAMLS